MADRNDELGYDIDAAADIDRGGRSASGTRLVANAILHRLTTDELPLIDSPSGYEEYGEDVRRWLGEALTTDTLNARAAGLGIILERDPRISTAEVTGTLTQAPGSLYAFELTVTAHLRTGETISLVMGVSAVTVEILSQGR